MSFRYALVACALVAVAASCAQPTPTPDIQATVDAAVRAALAAQAPPTPTATPAPILSSEEAEAFIRGHLLSCVAGWGLGEIESQARYLGDNLWLVNFGGKIGKPNPFFPDPEAVIGTHWRSGQWHLNELTGDLQAYDPTARNLSLELCDRLLLAGAS